MNPAITKSLERLKDEFERAATRYQPLYYEQVTTNYLDSVGPGGLTTHQWSAFVRNNKQTVSWEQWDEAPRGNTCGRFFGAPEGLTEFIALAESVYLVLQEVDRSLPHLRSPHGWLFVLHDMASSYPTPLVRMKERLWGGIDSEELPKDWKTRINAWEWSDDDTPLYPVEPVVEKFPINLFSMSAAAIEIILNGEAALLVGDYNNDLPIVFDSEADKSQNRKGNELTPQKKNEIARHAALALVAQEPHLSCRQLALRVGCDVNALTRNGDFMTRRDKIIAVSVTGKASERRGFFDPRTGAPEAGDEQDDQ